MRTDRNVTLRLCLVLATLLSSLIMCHGFILKPSTRMTSTQRTTLAAYRSTSNSQDKDEEVNYFLKDFVFYNGEVIDPYHILKVPRQADERTIKQAYRRQSRLYHPDAARHRDILPGSCNDEQDVREQWERINWSYDLLSNAQRRRKYDRHEALADPGRALRRAAAQAAWAGVTSVSKGLWNAGSAAVTNIMTTAKEARAATSSASSSSSSSSGGGTRNGTSTILEYKSHHAGLQSGLQQDAKDMEAKGEQKAPIIVPIKEM